MLHTHPLTTAAHGHSADAVVAVAVEGNAVAGDALEHVVLVKSVESDGVGLFCRSDQQVLGGDGHSPPAWVLEGDVLFG